MNETKMKILECLSDGNWRTSPELAQWCGLKLGNVSELLRRYRSQNLLIRRRNPAVSRGFLYRITAAGIERLRYLNDSTTETSAVLADRIGLSEGERRILGQWVKTKLGG